MSQRQHEARARASFASPIRRNALYSAIESGLRAPAVTIAPSGRVSMRAGLALGAALSLATLAPATSALAATIEVTTAAFVIAPDGECSLPEAVANANAGTDVSSGDCAAGEPGLDTIEFDAELAQSTITFERSLRVDEALAIEGLGRDELTFQESMPYAYSMISATAPLTLSGVTMYGGSAYYGGAISATDDLTVRDSRFVENRAYESGGAIHGVFEGKYISEGDNDSAQWLIERTEFEGNSSGLTGGAIAFHMASYDGGGSPSLTIRDSQFRDNSTFALGGAVDATPRGDRDAYAGSLSSTVAIEGSSFETNRAEIAGGGAFLSASTITIGASRFEGNSTAYFEGGGLFIEFDRLNDGSTASIDGSAFDGNTAAGRGGGIFAGGVSLAITDTTITNNRATRDSGPDRGGGPQCGNVGGPSSGGGLFAYAEPGQTVTIGAGTRIESNCAENIGGGVALRVGGGQGDPAVVVIADAVVADNRASFGAGIGSNLASDTGFSISRTTIEGNAAPFGPGGGVLLFSYDVGGEIRIEDTTIAGNESGSGGGIAIVAAADGASIDAAIVNTTIHANASALPDVPRGNGPVADGYGGGVVVVGAHNVAFEFVTLSGNTAQSGGGGLAADSAGVAFRNSIVAGNVSSIGPDLLASVDFDFSLLQNPGAATISGGDNLTLLDPELGPLQDNGGPTRTRLPQTDSPVLDAGDPAFSGPPDFDQRGAGFARIVGGRVDLGATEGAGTPEIISVVIAPDTIAEGSAATLTVNLDRVAPLDVLATVAFSGTAVLDADFTSGDDDGAAGIQVRIPGGSQSGSVAIDALVDAIVEPDEPFTATVASATGATIAGGAVADTATITDATVLPSVTLTLAPATIFEGGAAATLTLTLSAVSAVDVVVTLDFGGAATFDIDYTVADADAGTAGVQVVIPAGQLSASVPVVPLLDADAEGNEDIVASITGASGATVGATSQGSVVIQGSVAAPATPRPAIVPTLSEWMLMLLGLLLPATVVARLRRDAARADRAEG